MWLAGYDVREVDRYDSRTAKWRKGTRKPTFGMRRNDGKVWNVKGEGIVCQTACKAILVW